MVKSLTITTTCDYGNRYVTSFVNELSKLESDIVIQRYRGREANAKSISLWHRACLRDQKKNGKDKKG